ncbi:MAG TPA: hypothetical protein VIR81_12415, partial [Myxococcales bacterium]
MRGILSAHQLFLDACRSEQLDALRVCHGDERESRGAAASGAVRSVNRLENITSDVIDWSKMSTLPTVDYSAMPR